VLKVFGSLARCRAIPRAMLSYDASLAWAAILLLAIGS
jgi:hypothetical protein